MKSHAHALISVVVAAAALAVTASPYHPAVVVAVAVVVGVGIDVDHFVIAWWKTGGVEPVRRCLRDPKILFVEQDAVFETGEVGAVTRLLSHVVIGGVAVPLLWLRWPYLAGLVGASLYAHVLADLYATTRQRVAVETERASAETLRAAGREPVLDRDDPGGPSGAGTVEDDERED